MTVLAPPDTHYIDGLETDLDDVEELDEDRPCHILSDDMEVLCGAELGALAVPHSVLADRVLESPCASGCGRPRCASCAAVYEELGG